MHFDTFRFIKVNHTETEELFSKQNKKIKLPLIGESFTI